MYGTKNGGLIYLGVEIGILNTFKIDIFSRLTVGLLFGPKNKHVCKASNDRELGLCRSLTNKKSTVGGKIQIRVLEWKVKSNSPPTPVQSVLLQIVLLLAPHPTYSYPLRPTPNSLRDPYPTATPTHSVLVLS